MYQNISESVDWFAILFKKLYELYVQQVDELSTEVSVLKKDEKCVCNVKCDMSRMWMHIFMKFAIVSHNLIHVGGF